MSDNEIFADSDDTNDLITDARKDTGKKRLQKKSDKGKKSRDIPDADDDDDDAGGLFDSDSEDESSRKPSSKNKKLQTKSLSKKEKLEALQKRKRSETQSKEDPDRSRKKKRQGKSEGKDGNDKGYESGDSYDSLNFRRTQEDDDFIDAEGEDPEALKELYAEQHFDDERPDDEDSEEERKKKKKMSSKIPRRKGPDALSDEELNGDKEPDNPIMAAVYRMKRKKKEVKKLSELEDIAKEFLQRMDEAALQDENSIKERRPATKKLSMLPEVLDMLTKKDMMRPLLDFDLLAACKRWVQPLPNGKLGNVTLRQRLLEAIGRMTGEKGVTPDDLKRSEFGKAVMALYMHKTETPQMKRQLKSLIEQWSRPIFQKSGNMRDLQRAHETRREGGIAAISRAQQMEQAMASAPVSGRRPQDDLSSIISKGHKGGRDLGNGRVRVPYSKGFQFTVRPDARTGDVQDKRMSQHGKGQESRGNLSKRMLEKSRPAAKNQRSANISIEGRMRK